ncbi:unnamed protein product, partial [Rotaria sp. Silwood2]
KPHKANGPPSPRLSAINMNIAYFNETTTIKLHTCNGHTVHFDDIIYTDDDCSPSVAMDDNNRHVVFTTDEPNRQLNTRYKSGILKRRENTITTADAPRIILSDEGLKTGRVSPFINFPLFISMTIRSVGVIFGDMLSNK